MSTAPTTEMTANDVLWARDRGREEMRQHIMALIEADIPLWGEDIPPRHALSVLWGKIRDCQL